MRETHVARGWLRPWLLLTPTLLLLAAFFAVPFAWLVRLSLYERASGPAGFYLPETLTLANYGQILTDRYFGAVAGATLRLGLLVTAAAVLLAYPLAAYIWSAGPRLKQAVILGVLLPKLTNLLVAMYGVLVLLSAAGPINGALLGLGIIGAPLPMFANLFAVVAGETLIILPYPVLIIATALHGVNPELYSAARGLGASAPRAFFEVPFKLTLPSTILATLVTLIWALGAFTAPVILGNPELYPVSVEVFTQTFEDVNWPTGAALAVLNSGAVLLLVLLTYALQRRVALSTGQHA
ncbi:MAG: ABC transporter permease [Chloroflexota bacterium]